MKNLESNNQDIPELCRSTKEQLDFILESGIDARLKLASGGEPLALSDLSADSQDHLSTCADCQNYQLANRMLTEAARDLPGLTTDRELTDSIMLAFDKEVAAEVKAKIASFTYLKFAASFIAFILVGSGISVDSIWSAGAWMAALAVVALLKPLLETQPVTA
jgi:hypothetical protein